MVNLYIDSNAQRVTAMENYQLVLDGDHYA